MDKKYKDYLYHVCAIIKERALQSKKEEKNDKNLFNSGKLLAYNEVISVLQQEALGADISLRELQLEEVKPDIDLVESV